MLNKDKKCVFTLKQSYFFSNTHEVAVYDRDKDNVLVNSTYYTISKEDIERIKYLIRNSKYIFNDNELEESDICVLDGSEDDIYLSVDNKEVNIYSDNFFLRYEDFPLDTKVGELYNICTKIIVILKENGINEVDLDDD